MRMKPMRAAQAERYTSCNAFLNILKKATELTPTQKQMLWKRALNGDLRGAEREYHDIMVGKRR